MPPPSVRALPHLRRCAYITARTVAGTHLRRLELPPVQFGTHRSGCHTARWFCSGEQTGSSSNRERTSQPPVTGVSATKQPSKSRSVPEAPADARVASTGTGTETDSAANSAADTQRPESSKSQEAEPATGSRLEALLAAQTEQLERVRQLARNSLQFSSRLLGVGIFAAIVIPGYLIINWGMVRTGVSRESAEVISETIRDERIQFSAQEFSKALLNQLLTDEEVAKLVAKWVYQVLVSMQTEIGGLFVRILQQEQVVEGVNRLADRLVAYLCSSASVQEQVGRLLVYAICLPDSRDAAAKWAYELVMREDVTYGFRDLVVAALQTDAVVREAQALARQVLQDPDLVAEAKRAIAETLRDSEVRATAKESLWHIVSPWRSSGRAPDNKKSSKLLDELIAADSLTQEERQVLRGLQARLRSGTAPAAAAAVSPATGASSQAGEVEGPPVAATPPTAAHNPESPTVRAKEEEGKRSVDAESPGAQAAPEAAPVADPEMVPVPEPAPAPEPAPEPVPVPVAEPVPTPAPEPAPASVPEPPTAPEPESTSKPPSVAPVAAPPTAPGAPVLASPSGDPPVPMPPPLPDILESTQETLEVQEPGTDRDASADSEQVPADPTRGKDFSEIAPPAVQEPPLEKDEEGEADDGPFDRPDLF